MAWLGKVSLGNFPDLAGAVTKLSESVKNIEKNFDSAFSLEEKPDAGEGSGLWPSSSDRKALFDPVMAFMGQKSGDSAVESSEREGQSHQLSSLEKSNEVSGEELSISAQEKGPSSENKLETRVIEEGGGEPQITETASNEHEVASQTDSPLKSLPVEDVSSIDGSPENFGSSISLQESELMTEEPHDTQPTHMIESEEVGKIEISADVPSGLEDLQESQVERNQEVDHPSDEGLPIHVELLETNCVNAEPDTLNAQLNHIAEEDDVHPLTGQPPGIPDSEQGRDVVSDPMHHDVHSAKMDAFESDGKDLTTSLAIGEDTANSTSEIASVMMEMKMMEAALQGAARQAQAKADEIAKLMTENEQLKSVIEDLKRKSGESEIDALREEYHQRVASLERKLYALTKERDTLRREQNRKSDATALLKEKDEIINQVMAEVL